MNAANEQPGGHWWIKADSCDLTSGLMESVSGKWSGDVDLVDGKVEDLYQSYQSRQQLCNTLGLKEPRPMHNVKLQIHEMRDEVVRI